MRRTCFLSAAMTQCIGYWKSGQNGEEFDDYLKDIGMGFAHRKISKLITSWEDISLDGDTWIIHIHTSVRQGTHRYKAGEHCDETTLDGRQVRSTLEIVGDRLVIHQNSREEGKPDVIVSRQRQDENTLMMHIETKKVKTTRVYIKQEKAS